MFKCYVTQKQTQPRETACKLVTHIRNKTYHRKDKYGQDVVNGQGTEIVKEVMVCRELYDQVIAEGFQPEVVK